MKWQGLRQSANFIDLRNTTSIELVWQPNDKKTDLSKASMLITTAGTIFDSKGKSTLGKMSLNASAIRIIVNYQAGIHPTVTASQKKVLEQILRKCAGRPVTITSNAGELQELATGMYRTIQG